MSNPLKKTMVFLGLAEEDYDELTGEVLPTESVDATETVPHQGAAVTPLRRVHKKTTPAGGTMNEIVTVHPTEYKDAQTVAESFRMGVPVIINLSRMTDTDAKRMIDFCSGLSIGLSGKIERVTNKVFLLSPEHIAVSTEDDSEEIEPGTKSFFVNGQ